MDRQKVFSIVKEHLLKQNKRCNSDSHGVNGYCKYRAFNKNETLKCAVGSLIPDNEYVPAMDDYTLLKEVCGVNGGIKDDESSEQFSVTCGVKYNPLVITIINKYYGKTSNDDLNFLVNLQVIHDKSDDTDYWPESLKEFCNLYGLNYNQEPSCSVIMEPQQTT